MSKEKTKDEPKRGSDTVGGFAFFLSLVALTIASIFCCLFLVAAINKINAERIFPFLSGLILGSFIALVFIRGKLSVFIHEFKHSFVANLVGNKWKSMKVNDSSGHFEYSYSKATSHYNAFISLAPYCLHVFTFLSALIGSILFWNDVKIVLLMMGLGFGIDLILNARDISPVQTDISLITGGFLIGLLYIFFWNLSVGSVLFIWVTMGWQGWGLLVDYMLRVFLQ